MWQRAKRARRSCRSLSWRRGLSFISSNFDVASSRNTRDQRRSHHVSTTEMPQAFCLVSFSAFVGMFDKILRRSSRKGIEFSSSARLRAVAARAMMIEAVS